jgi:hypothetical protein
MSSITIVRTNATCAIAHRSDMKSVFQYRACTLLRSGFEEEPMRKHTMRRLGVNPMLAGLILLVSHPGQARAQYGMGMGWGWGFGFHQVPSPTQTLDQIAITRAGQGLQGVLTRTPYANNPNAYINHIREPGFVPHYQVARRPAPIYRSSERTSVASADTAAAARNLVPALATFFDAASKLVWPSEAPFGGELKEKRNLSDEASLAVLEETRRQPAATISSVTYARQQLVQYGQPALLEIRTKSTPVIADSFHNFLLSLYESLAKAADPPTQIPPAPPIP